MLGVEHFLSGLLFQLLGQQVLIFIFVPYTSDKLWVRTVNLSVTALFANACAHFLLKAVVFDIWLQVVGAMHHHLGIGIVRKRRGRFTFDL